MSVFMVDQKDAGHDSEKYIILETVAVFILVGLVLAVMFIVERVTA